MKRAAHKSEENKNTYEMRRPSSVIRFEDEEDETEPTPSKMESISKAGNKAKDFLSNIFPFDE